MYGVAGRGEWQAGRAEFGGDDVTPLADDWEVMVVPGLEYLPAAIIAHRARDGAVRILEQNDRFAGLYSQGVPAKLIGERSRRVPIERSQEMRRVRRELVSGFGHEGMNEGAPTNTFS